MSFAKYIVALGCAALLGACSATVSSDDDEDASSELSSSSKRKSSSSTSDKKSSSSNSSDKKSSAEEKDSVNSSSSKEDGKSSSSTEELDEDCIGESGKPWDGTTAKTFACGAGTKLSPYIILTAEQLAKLAFVIGANEKDYQGKYYKLGADIILNEGKIIDDKGTLLADSTKLHKWTPIGNYDVAFDGTFDGDGHTVSNIFINTTSSNNGLFGNNHGTIQNIIVKDSWINGGKYTAGIVGSSVGTVENLTNYASVSGKEDCIGGVLGASSQKKYQYNSIIKNTTTQGIIVGQKNVGGVAGCATAVTVDGANNTATIEGFGYVGGIFGGIGSSSNNDIKNLMNIGVINGSHFVGGIAGHCGGSPSIASHKTSTYYCSKSSYTCGSIPAAYNSGNITGIGYVGGVVGEVCNGKMSKLSNTSDIIGERGTGGIVSSMSYTTASSVYNTGNIYGGTYVGGIVGFNEEGVTNAAYSTGKVDGDSLVDLMIGYNYNTTMADYYYLEQGEQEPFGLNNGGGVATPKSADEMKSKEFAELLGDEFIYDADVNDGYPILKSETEGD